MNDKKKLLIDTALHLFYENGINSVGINEILKVSGVAKKTMYNHFKSKDCGESSAVTVLTSRGVGKPPTSFTRTFEPFRLLRIQRSRQESGQESALAPLGQGGVEREPQVEAEFRFRH